MDSAPSRESGFVESLIDSVTDPVFVKDRKHRWVLFNDAFVALLGRPRVELLGKSDYDFFPKAQADVFWRQDELVFETGRENSNEEMLTDAKGQTHVLVTRKVRWTSASGESFLIGTIRDITELVNSADDAKRSKERLHRAEKLETLGHLAGGMAHDFNNLLTAIVGCADLLLESLPAGDPSRRDVEEIRVAGRRGANLTGRLLSLTRRPAGLPRRVALGSIAHGMIDMLRRLLPADVDLVLAAKKSAPAVRLDPGLVEQVLLNLVVNAGEAMRGGGKATIEVADAPKGGGGLRGRCVRLTVRDDGPGMSEKIRSRVFEPFFTTKLNGSGLGLSTVAETVRRSGGAVSVESAPGKGSAFHVFWPAVAGKAVVERGVPAPVRSSAGGRGRALVVDDDEAVRRFSARCLEREGYEVVSAESPAEALKLAEANDGLFELFVIDVVMPRMRGPELAARLTAHQPGARVVFTSGRRKEECALPDDGAPFLAKPYSARDLIASVSAPRRAASGPSRRARRPGRAQSRRKES